MSIERPKLSINEQVEYMDSKNITFNIITKEQAATFLTENNYYFKLKAYEKVYDKNPNSREGKYVNLEFAYLVELSTIDFYLRKEIITLCLSIEHYLKTKLLYDISENKNEDGYDIVQKFLSFNPDLPDEIEQKGKNSTCHELIQKYKGNYAVWHFVELISFRYFIDFFDYYYRINDLKNRYKGLLMPVKFLRNAAAHNNCLINHLKEKGGFEPNAKILSQVGNIKGISNKSLDNKMSNKIIHDFVVLLMVYNNAAGSNNRKYTMINLKKLFEDRFTYHKDYFQKNIMVTSSYEFVKKIIDFYYENSI